MAQKKSAKKKSEKNIDDIVEQYKNMGKPKSISMMITQFILSFAVTTGVLALVITIWALIVRWGIEAVAALLTTLGAL